MTFVAPGYVLIGRTSLISLEKGAVVWTYSVKSQGWNVPNRYGSAMPFETAFFPISVEQPRPAHTVVCMAMPDDEAKKATAAIDPAGIFLWAPGMDVKLDGLGRRG